MSSQSTSPASFVAHIKLMREAAGLSQPRMASQLGISKERLNHYENIHTRIPYVIAERLLELYVPDPPQREQYRKMEDYPQPDVSIRMAEIEKTLSIPPDGQASFGALASALRIKKKKSQHEMPDITGTKMSDIENEVYIPTVEEAHQIARGLGYANGLDEQFYREGKEEIELVAERTRKFAAALYAMRNYLPGKQTRWAGISQFETATGAQAIQRELRDNGTIPQHVAESVFSEHMVAIWENTNPRIKTVPDYWQTHCLIAYFERRLGQQIAQDPIFQGQNLPVSGWDERMFYRIAETLQQSIQRCIKTEVNAEPTPDVVEYGARLTAIMNILEINDKTLARLSGLTRGSVINYRTASIATGPGDTQKQQIQKALGLDDARFATVGDAALHVLEMRAQAKADGLWKKQIESAARLRNILQKDITTRMGMPSQALRALKQRGPADQAQFTALSEALGHGKQTVVKRMLEHGVPSGDDEAHSYAIGAAARALPPAECMLYQEAGMQPNHQSFKEVEHFRNRFFSQYADLRQQHGR